MPRKNKSQYCIDYNPLLKKAIDGLVRDILSDSLALPEALKRACEIGSLYNFSATYIEGYIWGYLVTVAQHSNSAS